MKGLEVVQMVAAIRLNLDELIDELAAHLKMPDSTFRNGVVDMMNAVTGKPLNEKPPSAGGS